MTRHRSVTPLDDDVHPLGPSPRSSARREAWTRTRESTRESTRDDRASRVIVIVVIIVIARE
jgi:hypothetical protein